MKLIVLSVSCSCLALHGHMVLAKTNLRRLPVGQDSNKLLDPRREKRRLKHSKGGPPYETQFPTLPSLPIFDPPLDALVPTTSPPDTPLPTISFFIDQGGTTPPHSPEFVPPPSTEPVVAAETSSPTPLPTPPPTQAPTLYPTITAQIVTSAPTVAATGTPTVSPVLPQVAAPTTDNIFIPGNPDLESTSAPQDHPSCEAAKNGEVFSTGWSLIVELNYELLTAAGSPLTLVASTLDGLFQDYAAIQLVNCTLGASSDIQGVAVSAQSTVVDRNCRYISGFNVTSSFCFVMKGALKVYKSENTTITDNEIRSSVWSTLRIAMNGPNSRGRILQDTTDSESIFINKDQGILDLYLLNQGTASVSRMNGQDTSQSSGKSISSGASATLIGIFLATFAAIALVYIRGRKHREGRSYAQKLTVVADGNSYQDDSDTYGSPRDDSYSADIKLPEQFADGIDPIDPPTPSQLSCPMSSSVSDGVPSVSLFEAYEATPAEQGDSILYNVIHQKRSSKRSMQTQNVLPLSQMRSRSILNISDELLEEPPPFLAKIPRSASRNSEKTPKSHRSIQPRSNNVAIPNNQRPSPGTTTSRPDPPRVTDPPESSYDHNDEYESRGISRYDQSLNDSFSVKAFLNGHCAAMESFYGSMKSEEDSIEERSTKPSPTSVTSLWSDPKIPISSVIGKNYRSSVNLWISQCAEATNDDNVEPWTITTKKHAKSLSPYGNDAGPTSSQTPNTKSHLNSQFSEDSPDRGRSPTPILDSTNSRRGKSRNKTPNRTERNPPGHRIAPVEEISTIPSSSSSRRSSSKSKSPYPRYVTPTSIRGSTSSPSSPSSRRSSSKSKSPYPRYVTPTSIRGSTNYVQYASDTVEL